MCCPNVTPFTTKCPTALSDEPAPRTTKRPNYRAIYVFVRGFKWALVSQGSHIGEVRHSIWKGSFITEQPIPLLDECPRKKMTKKGRNKKWQLCSLQQFGWACLSGCSAERSSMCFRDCSGRGSAETAGSRRQTGNSWLIKHGDGGQHSGGVWGPPFQPGDKPPPYQLEQASVSRTPHHATPPIISNKPYLSGRPSPFSNTVHLHNSSDWLTWDRRAHRRGHAFESCCRPSRRGKQCKSSPEVNRCHLVILLWAAGWQFGVEAVC